MRGRVGLPVPDTYHLGYSSQRYMSWENDITTKSCRAGQLVSQYGPYRRGIDQSEPVHPRYSGLDHTDKAVVEFLSRGFFGSKDYKRAGRE